MKTTEKTTNENSIKTCQKALVEAVRPFFGPQNMFDCAFLEERKCSMWHLIIETRWKVEKKKKAKLSNTFFRNKIISTVMKAISYKKK